MPAVPSFEDLVAQAIAQAQDDRPDLRFDEGSPELAIVHGGAAMGDAVIRFAAQALKETFLDGARDEALIALVDDRYDIEPEPATPATVAVEFERTSGGAAGAIPAGTVVATPFDDDGDEVRFTTDAEIPVANGDNGPFAGTATAAEVGPSGNVDAGEVSRIVDELFDDFTVTNPKAAAGGNPAESNEELRRRARAFWATVRRATLDALERGAREVPGVRYARAVEDPETGAVTMRVADAEGGSTLQMVAEVDAQMDLFRAAGAIVTTTGGTALHLDLDVSVTLADGATLEALRPLIRDALIARFAAISVGDKLYRDHLTAAVIGVDPRRIHAVDFGALEEVTTPDPGRQLRPGDIVITEAA